MKHVLKGIERNLKDTNFDTTWNDFLEIARSLEFENGLTQSFIGNTNHKSTGKNEEEILFFNRDKGLILYANSITLNERLISSARVYGEVKIHEKISIEQLNALSNCSYGFVHQGTLHFNVDVCEGFCDKINSLSEAFEFIPIWTRVPLLLFLNSTEAQRFLENMQTKAYEEITKEKILKSKPEVSKIIYGQ